MRKLVLVFLIAAMLVFSAVPAMAADLSEIAPEADTQIVAVTEEIQEAVLEEGVAQEAPAAEITEQPAEEVAEVAAFTAEIKGAEQPIVAPNAAKLELYINGVPATENSGYTFEWQNQNMNNEWVELIADYKTRQPEMGATVAFDSTNPDLDGYEIRCVVTNKADGTILETEQIELKIATEHTVLTVNNQPILPGSSNAEGTISLSADGSVVEFKDANVVANNWRWSSAAVYIEPIGTDLTVKLSGSSKILSDFATDNGNDQIRNGTGIQVLLHENQKLTFTTDNAGVLNSVGGFVGMDLGRYAGKKASAYIEGGATIEAESLNPIILKTQGCAFSSFLDLYINNGTLTAKTLDSSTVSVEGPETGLTIGKQGKLISENNSPQVGDVGSGIYALTVAPNLTVNGGSVTARMSNSVSVMSTGIAVEKDLTLKDAGELRVYLNSPNTEVGTVTGVWALNINTDSSSSIRSTVKTKALGATAIHAAKKLRAVGRSYVYGNAVGGGDTVGIYVGTGNGKGLLEQNHATVKGISTNAIKKQLDVGILSDKISAKSLNGKDRYGKLIGESTTGGQAVLSLLKADSKTKQDYKANYKPQSFKIEKGSKIITPKKVGEISTYSAPSATKGRYNIYETVYGVSKNAVVQSRVVIG